MRSSPPDTADGLAPARKKLLVILGAGSSLALGLPSVDKLSTLVRGWAADWSRARGWPDYYGLIETAQDRARAAPTPGVARAATANFETLLGDMVGLAHWLMPGPSGASLRHVLGGPAALADLNFPHPGPYGPTHVVQDQLEHILKALAVHMRQCSAAIDPAAEAAEAYRSLLAPLHDAFDVGVYNLNYDSAALMAWPSAYTGFEQGAFAPARVHTRTDWGFIYHLHGSVHHALADPYSDRIVWRDDLAGAFDDAHQPGLGDERSDGRAFPKSTLIAGGFKLDQLLVEPFHSHHAALVRHAYEADAILIGGYGFADAHVNRALRNRFEMSPPDDRPPVAIIDWAGAVTMGMAGRSDDWSSAVARNLKAPVDFFREPGRSDWPVPQDLVARDAFEVSALHRVALWHGGFERAATRSGEIAAWLERGDPNDLKQP